MAHGGGLCVTKHEKNYQQFRKKKKKKGRKKFTTEANNSQDHISVRRVTAPLNQEFCTTVISTILCISLVFLPATNEFVDSAQCVKYFSY